MIGQLRQNGSGTMAELGPDLHTLSLLVQEISPEVMRVKIGAPGRWEVPRSIFNTPNTTGKSVSSTVLKQSLFSSCWLFSGKRQSVGVIDLLLAKICAEADHVAWVLLMFYCSTLECARM